jgi:hypothetical protein
MRRLSKRNFGSFSQARKLTVEDGVSHLSMQPIFLGQQEILFSTALLTAVYAPQEIRAAGLDTAIDWNDHNSSSLYR